MVPLAPWLWPFMCFLWPLASRGAEPELIMHVFADFGTRGMPGTFKVLLVDVVVQMARSEFVLTLPLPVYVDDATMIGDLEKRVTAEMHALQRFTSYYCGVNWKMRKDRPSAQRNLYVGFVWDSPSLTITLEEKKLISYLDTLARAAAATALSLRERQSLAGKMQRAIYTLPPGAACLLVHCYALMSGLTLGWQRRRTTRAERRDYLLVHDLLQLNMGKGYYRYDLFALGPTCLSDASKSRGYTGGGYVCSDGFYDFFKYSGSAARKPIDFLEGDVVRRCCAERCAQWKNMLIDFGIDSQAFERSAEAGRSKAPRLNDILKSLFALQLQSGFILRPFWLSTHANYLADHLSRGRVQEFLDCLPGSGFVGPLAVAYAHREVGRVVDFSQDPVDAMVALRQSSKYYSSNYTGDGPARGPGVGGDAQLLSLQYTSASIFDGLLPEYMEMADVVFDQRLAPSSMSRVMTAYRRWEAFAESHDLPVLIPSGHRQRGGWIASWTLQMLTDTALVYSSISTYVWGMRTWHVLQHVDDPAFGVKHYREWMQGIAVLSAVPGEPRREIPYEVVRLMLESLDWGDLVEVQFGLFILILLFTFSRSETPCPKNFTGSDGWDDAKHWMWKDFKLVRAAQRWVLWVRFKGFKQDPRIQRPEASHAVPGVPFDPDVGDSFGRDWVPVGDVDDPLFSVSRWFIRHAQLLQRKRVGLEPMFLARDRTRPYTYSAAMTDLRERLRRVGGDATLGLHGFRVLGYNLSKRSNGEELTVAHGGWRSQAHSRYERFRLVDVYSIPSKMVGAQSPYVEGVARCLHPARRQRGSLLPELSGSDSSSDSDAPEPDSQDLSGLPPGYVRDDRTAPSGRQYLVVFGPDGSRHGSRPAAWRHYLEARSAGVSSASAPAPAVSPAVSPSSSIPSLSRDSATPAVPPSPRVLSPADLSQHVVYADRPSTRRPPAVRSAPRQP